MDIFLKDLKNKVFENHTDYDITWEKPIGSLHRRLDRKRSWYFQCTVKGQKVCKSFLTESEVLKFRRDWASEDPLNRFHFAYYTYQSYVICRSRNSSVWIMDRKYKHLLGEHKWSKNSYGYIRCTGKNNNTFLHRLILTKARRPPKPKEQCDHINQDRDDNRLSNLRWVSVTQNNNNRKVMRTNTSGRTGVYHDSAYPIFIAKCGKTTGKFKYKEGDYESALVAWNLAVEFRIDLEKKSNDVHEQNAHYGTKPSLTKIDWERMHLNMLSGRLKRNDRLRKQYQLKQSKKRKNPPTEEK